MALSSRIARKIKSLSSLLASRPLSVSTHLQPSEDATTDPRFLLHSSPVPRLSDHSTILHFPEIRVSTRPNGVRVVTQSSPTSAVQTASVGVWIDAGSRFETPETNGTAHFLEHMIFKGTHRRSARALEEEIENMGARLNAYTSREQTTFYANVLRGDVPVAIDILADILQNSLFSETAIRRERGVILREMEEVQGQAEEVIFDYLHSAAFQNNPLGNTILGPEENIQTISRVVSAAGAVRHEDIVNQVSRKFKRLSTDPTTATQLVSRNPAVFTGSEVRVVNNDFPIAHLVVAFKGAGWADPNSIPVMVLQSLLGSWNKSVGIGNFSGWASSLVDLFAGLLCFSNTWAQVLYAATTTDITDSQFSGQNLLVESAQMAWLKPDCLHDLSLVIMEEFRRLAQKISEPEVIRARNQLKSALLLHIDGTSAIAENNGRQMLTYGRIVPFLELFARIDAVDAPTIKETAQAFIINKTEVHLDYHQLSTRTAIREEEKNAYLLVDAQPACEGAAMRMDATLLRSFAFLKLSIDDMFAECVGIWLGRGLFMNHQRSRVWIGPMGLVDDAYG
ncbi:hypothetical protein ACLOJK_037828 [Asimina triloba]